MSKWFDDWGMLVTMLVFAITGPVFLAPDATIAFLGSSEVWQVVERSSWIATVIALGFIYLEQRRTANELSRRPKLIIRFDKPYARDGEPTSNITTLLWPEWPANELTSAPTELGFVLFNVGDKTAREVTCNFLFPSAAVTEVQANRVEFTVSHEDGRIRVVTAPHEQNPKNLHPWSDRKFVMWIRVKPVDLFMGEVRLGFEDTKTKHWVFSVVIRTRPAMH